MSELKAGMRIRLVRMGDDPCPMEPGATGTIDSIVENAVGPRNRPYLHLNMTWDPHVGRSLNLCVPPDEVEVLPQAAPQQEGAAT